MREYAYWEYYKLEAVCGTYFIPEVHPDNPEYATDSTIARDYSLWLSSGDPAVLRRAYKKMERTRTHMDVSMNPFNSGSNRSIWTVPLPLLELKDRWLLGSWPWRE